MHEGKYKFYADFEIGARVTFDGNKDIVCRITQIKFCTNFYPEYYIEWLHNGTLVVAWVAEWRLVLV